MASMAAPSPAPMHGSFFDLAVELRLKVYELLFCFEDPITLKLDEYGVIKHERSSNRVEASKQKVHVHTFQLCKRFYLEASPVLYRCNKFSLQSVALRNDRLRRTQPVCKLLESLEIRCVRDSVWGYVQITNYLSECMPSLHKLDFIFESPYALIAASLEFSSATTPCAPLFEGPTIQLSARILKEEKKAVNVRPCTRARSEGSVRQALDANPEDLTGVLPRDNGHIGPLTHSELSLPGSRLSLIQLTGKITPHLLERVQKHTCTMNDCTWVETHEEANPVDALVNDAITTGRRTHLRWGTTGTDTPVPNPKKEVDMLQFYPEMTAKDQKILQEFLKSRNRTETSSSMKDSGDVSDAGQSAKKQRIEHQAVAKGDQTAADASGDTIMEDQSRTINDNDTSLVSTPTYASTTPEANADNNLNSSSTLSLTNHDLDYGPTDESTHATLTPEDMDAFWAAQFGGYAADFGVGPSIHQTDDSEDEKEDE